MKKGPDCQDLFCICKVDKVEKIQFSDGIVKSFKFKARKS